MTRRTKIEAVQGAEDRVELERRRAKRRRMAIILVAVVLLVPTVAMVVVNRIETEVPAPLWTQDALPIPEEAVNGWPLIAHYHSTTISGIDLAPIDKLLGASTDAKLVELGPLFRPARVVASKIEAHTAICREAFERERMVVPCLSTEPGACTHEPLAICSRLLSFEALDQASRGSPAGAQLLALVTRRLADAAGNSPHPWVQARTMLLLRKAIHHAAVVIKWRRSNTQPAREALEAISEESLPREHLAIGSYLLKHLALREALARTDTWLLDEGSIMRGLEAPFRPVKEGGEVAPPPDYTAGAFWWFDNPIGKKMLDAVKPGADEDYLRTKELRASVLKRRQEALKLR